MKHISTGMDHIFGPWIMEQTGSVWVPGRGSTIGLYDDEQGILACTYFTDFNGASVIMHCAGEGKHWMNREFLWFSFHYPFEQLQAKKIISPIESSNLDCIRFTKHIGFDLEATLLDASPKGDLLLFSLRKENCKWLSLRNKYRGEAQSTAAT